MSCLNWLELIGQSFTGFKLSHFLSFDLDDLASLRVSTVTCSTFGYRESTETYQGYFTTFFQAVSNSFGERIQGFVSLSLSDAGIFSQFVD